ncbi:MAG TPA: penicillin-binding transpeptidase domain-containing protein [Kineosporiaceae bacterium]
MPSSRTRIVIGVLVAVLAVGAAVPAAYLVRDHLAKQHLREAVSAFATAWRSGRLETVRYHGVTGTEAARQAAAITAGLTTSVNDVPVGVDLGPMTGPSDGRGSASLHVRWDLGGGLRWQYDTTVSLVDSGGWQVDWSPAVVHPKLIAGQIMTTSRTSAGRGQITGAGGQVLVTQRPVVLVGIQPSRAKDRRSAAAAAAAVVGVDAADLTRRVLTASPNAFVDVIVLREEDYEAVKARLLPIPGVVFQRTTRSLAPSAGFARALLGTTGPATKEIVDASQGRVRAGDVTGLSGVQRRYDAQLAGTPGTIVQAVPAATGGPTSPITLYSVPPVNGTDLAVTLDLRVQQAAEAALAASAGPSALVAIRASTGDVLAVANGPAAAAGYNRALIGRYPPGSTFKVATTFALLQAGVTPSTPVDCPATITVDGRVFQNAEGEVLGTAPFHRDFADSCNTAFIGAAQRLSQTELRDAATTLGYGRPNQLGVDAFMGTVPASAGKVEHAADAIGQGQVLTSPLVVASVSAAVAAGHYASPRLVLPAAGPGGTPAFPGGASPGGRDPASPGTTGSTGTTGSVAPSTTSSPTPLPDTPVTALRALMSEVVTSGTGTALQGVPGEPVHGKTGTAEFGNADPPQTHAWFTGYQSDIAFAIVVEGGGFGGKVAAPLAADFLRRLA